MYKFNDQEDNFFIVVYWVCEKVCAPLIMKLYLLFFIIEILMKTVVILH